MCVSPIGMTLIQLDCHICNQTSGKNLWVWPPELPFSFSDLLLVYFL